MGVFDWHGKAETGYGTIGGLFGVSLLDGFSFLGEICVLTVSQLGMYIMGVPLI